MDPASLKPPTAAGENHRPVLLLAFITMLVWLLGALWPRLLITLGIYDYGTAYLDSYAVLASLDAVRAGLDPHAANPLDVLRRPHVYSDWWLGLRWLGLTREHNYLVGTVGAGVFALAAWATARPRNFGEAFWLAAVLVSPPVLMVVSRANNDLAIFVLLAGVGLAAAATWGRTVIALACLALATGLKYFPAPAALAFLWIRPVRRMPVLLLAALVVVVLALASVWSQVDRSRFTIASGVYTMGAPLWWRELGWKDGESALPGALLIVIPALALGLSRMTAGLTTRGEPRERFLAALGAIVLLTCFLAGVNYAYRWIFVLWPALWLWRQTGDESLPHRQRRMARVGCGLVLLCLWLDGGLCATVNLGRLYDDQAWLARMQESWRLWTQPLHWLLMMLLAGWLVEGALATAREWWSRRHEE